MRLDCGSSRLRAKLRIVLSTCGLLLHWKSSHIAGKFAMVPSAPCAAKVASRCRLRFTLLRQLSLLETGRRRALRPQDGHDTLW